MKPWEVIATLLKTGALRPGYFDQDGQPHLHKPHEGDAVFVTCKRTGKIIDLDNVREIQVEHWPERHKHGGTVDPDNAIISLAEGHKQQTKNEQKADAKERRLHAKRHAEVPLSKPKYRLKKKLSGEVVKVRTK